MIRVSVLALALALVSRVLEEGETGGEVVHIRAVKVAADIRREQLGVGIKHNHNHSHSIIHSAVAAVVVVVVTINRMDKDKDKDKDRVRLMHITNHHPQPTAAVVAAVSSTLMRVRRGQG